MKTIYKSEDGKKKILTLYNTQLECLTHPYKDVWVETTFGKTHLIETSNLHGALLLIFHGEMQQPRIIF